MELSNISALKADAAETLRRGRKPREVVTWYAGGTVAIAVIATVLNILLNYRMGKTGGLGDMGLRSILETAQTILPMAQALLIGSLELGYIHAMMRISRKQYADRTDLKVGFQKFFPMLRLTILQCMLYCLLGFLTYQLASTIYMLTPWAGDLIDLLEPMIASGEALHVEALLDEAFVARATPAMIPMFLIWAGIACLVAIPVSYRMRMSSFCLLDDPKSRALAAMRTSVRITRRNCVKLFKLDLSFWWYYGMVILTTIVAYLDMILAIAGIDPGINPTVLSLCCYGISLAVTFAISYVWLNRIQCTYVMAYESICDRPKDNGVVLGNIFDLQ